MFPIGIDGLFSVNTDELFIYKMRGKAKIDSFQYIVVSGTGKLTFLLGIQNFGALFLVVIYFFGNLN